MSDTPQTADDPHAPGADSLDGVPPEVRKHYGLSAENAVLTDADRTTLDERIAGGWWGYYIHFEPTGVPEVDRVLSAVGLAGKMYHHTDSWNDDDADYGPIRKGESPVDFIQRAANDAAHALRLPSAKTSDAKEAR